MESIAQNKVQLSGETVKISYLADPVIGHGHYTLVNNRKTAGTFTVVSVWLELGDKKIPMETYSVYDRKLKQEIDPKKFILKPGSILDFYIGFPQRQHEPRFGAKGAVGLILKTEGMELQALSPLIFERRIPLTH